MVTLNGKLNNPNKAYFKFNNWLTKFLHVPTIDFTNQCNLAPIYKSKSHTTDGIVA